METICAADRGVYTPRQVSLLVNLRLDSRFDADTFRRWAHGYERAGRVYEPVIHPEYGPEAPVLSFVDLLELMFIGALRHRDVSLPVIRAAALNAARRFQTDHPFAVRRFRTDGRAIFADLERNGPPPIDLPSRRLVEELHRAQMVFPEMVEPYLEDIDWGEVEAQAYWPFGREAGIVLEPGRSFGQPIDADTGVPTEALYSFFSAGDNPQIIAEWYEIPVETVERAVEFERALRAA